MVATLVKTDEGAESRLPEHDHASWSRRSRGFGEARPGLTIPGKIEKMGYKGVETTEMVLDGVRVPASTVLGGEAAAAAASTR